ncbi:MAG: sugar ABC transporter permease [Armatimonadetes bacterium]|nr:sugar ABC transporter permease [Armatimonadota bacterium]
MKRSGTPYFFIAPALLHLVVFGFLPIMFALWVSFFDWKILKGTMPFVGLGKYQELMNDPGFGNALLNSAKYALVSVPTGMAVAVLVALLASDQIRAAGLFRTVYYIPAVCSTVAISMLWIYVYLPENGLINATTALFGLKSVDFLNEQGWAMPALAFMSVWVGLGPRMIIYVAGILGIPPSLYEAAELDGARGWRRFWSVTWPMLAPTNLFVLVTGTIAAFQLFTPVYMMTRGGPLDSTDVLGYHIYVESWKKFHVSNASAQSFLLLVVIGVLAAVQFKLAKRQLEGYSAG